MKQRQAAPCSPGAAEIAERCSSTSFKRLRREGKISSASPRSSQLAAEGAVSSATASSGARLLQRSRPAISFGTDDMVVPASKWRSSEEKPALVAKEFAQQYNRRLITHGEKDK